MMNAHYYHFKILDLHEFYAMRIYEQTRYAGIAPLRWMKYYAGNQEPDADFNRFFEEKFEDLLA